MTRDERERLDALRKDADNDGEIDWQQVDEPKRSPLVWLLIFGVLLLAGLALSVKMALGIG